jgi:Methyltransferase domain
MKRSQPPSLAEVESWMERLYVAAEGATLRREDRRKAVEVTAMLGEIARAFGSGREAFTLVDAAAGKSYVGLLAAKLVFEPAGRRARVVTLEREPERASLARTIAGHLETAVAIECRTADVGDAEAWPEHPDLVVALHACGPAADTVIERAVTAGARRLLLVPCCTSDQMPAAAAAASRAEGDGIPRQAPVRRRYLQVMVDAERTWRLEAAGYETEVVELVAPTVTPHNLLWRARRVGEPGRMAQAAAALARLTRR